MLLLRAGLFSWLRRSLLSPEVASALSVVDQLSRHSCGSLCIVDVVDVVDVVDERRGWLSDIVWVDFLWGSKRLRLCNVSFISVSCLLIRLQYAYTYRPGLTSSCVLPYVFTKIDIRVEHLTSSDGFKSWLCLNYWSLVSIHNSLNPSASLKWH